MKFKDIPQLTPPGSYEMNCHLPYLIRWIHEQEQELGLQLQPDFQRNHVWTEEQQIHFIEFLLKGGKSNRVLYFNHPGWMTDFNHHEGYNEFVCVDGLQRITAIQRFINNEIPVFGQYYYKDFEDRLPLDIDVRVNINNLQTKKAVLQWYVDINTGGTPHTNTEIQKVQDMIKQEP